MTTQKRTPPKLPNAGPYIARITSHLDPTFMGGVEAVLEEGTLNNPELKSHVFPLMYLSPFYGTTPSEWEGADPRNFRHVQKSYGMWMVPPTVGTRVLCIFIGGDPNQGYWLGCVGDRYQNHMVPGLAASTNVAWADTAQKEKYDVDAVPVGEFHRGSYLRSKKPNDAPKPVHPFADRLLEQGLLADSVRGITSSSARREFPSSVFGVSTPGPPDPQSSKRPVGYKDETTLTYSSKLSGHTFVMDDGDITGGNRLIRLRSGAGHQILLNDSDNVIYIANANGTAWLEFTANGKIDIFAQDSVSIHAQTDLNIRAGRDVSIDAARNINLKSRRGAMNLHAERDFNLRVFESKIFVEGDFNHYVKGAYNLTTLKDINLLSQEKMNLTGAKDISVISQGAFIIAATGKTKFGKPGTIAEAASAAIGETTKLTDYLVPSTSVSAGWRGQRYQAGTVSCIHKRVPMHEPWTLHENKNPEGTSPVATDSNVPSVQVSPVRPADPALDPPPRDQVPPVRPPETVTFAADVFFDFDKDVLKPEGEAALTQFANKLKAQGGTYQIVIEGHTDSIGTDAYNFNLSQRRANRVKSFLSGLGIPNSSMNAIGKGEGEPVAPNEIDGKDNPEGRAKNRRVVLTVTQISGPSTNPTPTPASPSGPDTNPSNWAQDKLFIEKVKQVAAKYKMDYLDLLAVMFFETGGQMKASTPGPGVATGLIQFTPEGIKGLPTTIPALRAMTRYQQMHYVDLYFERWTKGDSNPTRRGFGKNPVPLNDVYMIVFCPRAYGIPDNGPVYSNVLSVIKTFYPKPPTRDQIATEIRNFTANSYLDTTGGGRDGRVGDGIITKQEACFKLPRNLRQVKQALGIS